MQNDPVDSDLAPDLELFTSEELFRELMKRQPLQFVGIAIERLTDAEASYGEATCMFAFSEGLNKAQVLHLLQSGTDYTSQLS